MASAYPVTLSRDDNHTILVQFQDFPEAQTFGNNRTDALVRAVDALETVIDAYMRDRRPIPSPRSARRGQPTVALSLMAGLKVSIYRAMQDQRITKTKLAKSLHWHLPQVDRLLNIRHQSKLGQLEAAAKALGKTLDLTLQDERRPA